MDQNTTTKPEQQKTWTFADLDNMFRAMVDHPISTNWRKNADIAYKFEQGDQWDSTELKELETRGQPAIVENEIRPAKERLLGKFRKNRTTIKFAPRNETDRPIAERLGHLVRHVDYVNNYEFLEGDVGNDMLISGKGVLEVCLQQNELGEMTVKYRRDDPFTIFIDAFSKHYDWNEDARYMARCKWMYESDAVNRWPDATMRIKSAVNTGQPSQQTTAILTPSVLSNEEWWALYFDQKNRRLRPVEIYWKVRAKETIYNGPHGKIRVESGRNDQKLTQEEIASYGMVESERSIDQMWCAVFCGDIMLQEPRPKPDGVNLFPWIPYWGFRKADGEPQGYVWSLLDPQREINSRRSKALWALNNRQVIYERNAIRDKAELANELASMDGQVEIEPGKFDRFAIRENTDISQGNLAMLQEAKMAIRRTIGEDQINPAPEIRSGVGLQRIEQVQQDAVLTLFDNLRRSRRLKAALTYALIKQWYTDEMVFEITDEPNQPETIKMEATDFERIKESTYDIIATDAPDYINRQQEQFSEIVAALPQILQFGPQWAGLLLQMSDLDNKEGLMKQIEAMNAPPPMMPKVSVSLQWDNLTPGEKAVWALKFQMPELAQVELQDPQPPTAVMKEESEQRKTQMKVEGDILVATIKTDSEEKRASAKFTSDMAKTAAGEHKASEDRKAKSEERKTKEKKSE